MSILNSYNADVWIMLNTVRLLVSFISLLMVLFTPYSVLIYSNCEIYFEVVNHFHYISSTLDNTISVTINYHFN